MQLHGGKLKIISEIDVGTTVVATFPAERVGTLASAVNG